MLRLGLPEIHREVSGLQVYRACSHLTDDKHGLCPHQSLEPGDL